MNKLKSLFSIILTLALVMSFGIFAYADEDPIESELPTFTIENENGEEDVTATPITDDMTVLDESVTDGWYCVRGSVVMNHQLVINGNCGIILDSGSELDIQVSDESGILIPDGASLTIHSCDEESTIGNSVGPDLIVMEGSGELHLMSGNLYATETCIWAKDDCYVDLQGGYVTSGESDEFAVLIQNRSHGRMLNTQICALGHGVSAEGGDFIMEGGSISASNTGVANYCNFVMLGGEIKNCYRAIENFETLEIGGDAKISDNTMNVDLLGGRVMLSSYVDEDLCVGIYSEELEDEGTDEVLVMTSASDDDLAHFTCDDENLSLYITDGDMYIGYSAEEPVTTASVFSSSTGMLIAGGVLIAVVIIVAVVMKKKPMNQ